ncbi:MAG: ribose-phosphate diphosphokinase [Candidatus Nezhaarchaeota archaeon]|nr:ribose-phosphate diphosphokinase [Candidatus Nezhaarchaeota archaeon]
MVLVIAGPASRGLAKRIASELKAELTEAEAKTFPDGESYIRVVRSVKGEDVVIVQSCYSPQDKHLFELLLLVNTARDLEANNVVAVCPYLAYSRQDKRFLEGEAVSGRLVLRLIAAAGAQGLVTVDIHSEDLLKHSDIPAINVSAMPLLASYLSSRGLRGPFVLAPDRKRAREAEAVAKLLGGDYGYLEKVRDKATGEVRTEKKELPVEGRDVVIVDDIVSTGGTIASAASIAKSQGARRIVAACTHLILVSGSLERMYRAGVDEIVGTDSVESEFSRVSVAPALVEGLNKLLKL